MKKVRTTKRQPKDQTLTIRLEQDALNALREYAARADMSLNATVRRATRLFLEQVAREETAK